MRAAIIILNYNGRALLEQCLPSILKAAEHAKYQTEVAILDNQSTEGDADFIRKEYPTVRVEEASQNRFLCSYNEVMSRFSQDIVILLNNDIRVEEGFVDPLVEKFKTNKNTFLVAPKVMSFDGLEVQAGASKAGIRYGLFWCDARYRGFEAEVETPQETYSSGFGAFSREKFIQLGGYDDRYLPGIFEDVDLCFRAKQAGYDLFYEPKSVVYHMGQASFKRAFGQSQMSQIAHRNAFLFMWKNFHGFGFWFTHLFFLPFRLLYALIRGNIAMPIGLFRALNKGKKS